MREIENICIDLDKFKFLQNLDKSFIETLIDELKTLKLNCEVVNKTAELKKQITQNTEVLEKKIKEKLADKAYCKA